MTDNSTAKEIAAAKEMARLVIGHHFGGNPRRIAHKAGGLSNFVFEVKHAEGEFIVRISFDPGRINSFIKEQWAQEKAREAGVPTAEILEVGNEIIGNPFMISRAVDGQDAALHPERLRILREAGRYAALINGIKTDGFGGTFDWSSNLLSRREKWNDYLERELLLDARLETLEKSRMLSAARIKTLRGTFADGGRPKPKPVLNHGDIRLKNIMVDEAGKIAAIIDWEDCVSTVPAWELSLALHDLSIDEKQEFLAGYGLSEKKLRDLAPLIKAFNIINYTPEVERLSAEKNKAGLDRLRTRLSGALDLYSI